MYNSLLPTSTHYLEGVCISLGWSTTPNWGTHCHLCQPFAICFSHLQRDDFLLSVIVADAEGEKVDPQAFLSLQRDDLNEETLAVAFSGLHKLIHLALRVPLGSWKQNVSGFVHFLNLQVIGLHQSQTLCSYTSSWIVMLTLFQVFREDLQELQ